MESVEGQIRYVLQTKIKDVIYDLNLNEYLILFDDITLGLWTSKPCPFKAGDIIKATFEKVEQANANSK